MPRIPSEERSEKKAEETKNLSQPTIRLAVTDDGMPSKKVRYPLAFSGKKKDEEQPTIRLAHVPGAQGDNSLMGQKGVEALPESHAPALLISFFYLEAFLKNKHRYRHRDWAMDSGAFSAFNSGVSINLQSYIDTCKKLLQEDNKLSEVFALDVIGDWQATLRNTDEMWKQGVQAIPTFHYGEPWDVLKGISRDYPKIAIGGCAGRSMRMKRDHFAGQCFARVWPKRIHGFGFGHEYLILKYPWHSVDATSWEISPCGFGRWNYFGHIGKNGRRVGAAISVPGSKQNLRLEVEFYLDLEQRARQKWKKEMASLPPLEQEMKRIFNRAIPQTIRLVSGAGRSIREGSRTGLEKDDHFEEEGKG